MTIAKIPSLWYLFCIFIPFCAIGSPEISIAKGEAADSATLPIRSTSNQIQRGKACSIRTQRCQLKSPPNHNPTSNFDFTLPNRHNVPQLLGCTSPVLGDIAC